MADRKYLEEARAIALEEKRRQDTHERIKKSELKKLQSAIQRLKKHLPTEISFVEALTVLSFAFGMDFLDWLIIGSIPIIGDILDIITWALIFFWAWIRSLKRPPALFLSGIIEFIPFLDILPVWTAMVAGIIIYQKFLRITHEREIRKKKQLEREAKKIAAS